MEDHSSDGIQKLLESSQEELPELFQLSLYHSLGALSQRTKYDETQRISLGRGVVEVSGGRVCAHQHRFAGNYTVSENADLCASFLGITRTIGFGDISSEKIRKTLTTFVIFSQTTISVQEVEERTTEMMHCLSGGFSDNYLVRCPEKGEMG